MNKIQEAIKTLQESGHIVKVWSRDDIEMVISSDYPELSAEAASGLADRAMESGYWEALGDCTDQEWNLIDVAISEASDAS